jgi:type IV pilus assembly protein PilA
MATFEKNHNYANFSNRFFITLIAFALIIPPVVIFLISLFLDQYRVYHESEVKSIIPEMNRDQKSDYAQKGSFSNWYDLRLSRNEGCGVDTVNFTYLVDVTKNAAFHSALPKLEHLRAYVSGVFAVPSTEPNAAKNEMVTVAILCEAKTPSIIKPAHPYLVKRSLVCGDGTEPVKK